MTTKYKTSEKLVGSALYVDPQVEGSMEACNDFLFEVYQPMVACGLMFTAPTYLFLEEHSATLHNSSPQTKAQCMGLQVIGFDALLKNTKMVNTGFDKSNWADACVEFTNGQEFYRRSGDLVIDPEELVTLAREGQLWKYVDAKTTCLKKVSKAKEDIAGKFPANLFMMFAWNDTKWTKQNSYTVEIIRTLNKAMEDIDLDQ